MHWRLFLLELPLQLSPWSWGWDQWWRKTSKIWVRDSSCLWTVTWKYSACTISNIRPACQSNLVWRTMIFAGKSIILEWQSEGSFKNCEIYIWSELESQWKRQTIWEVNKQITSGTLRCLQQICLPSKHSVFDSCNASWGEPQITSLPSHTISKPNSFADVQ